MKWWGAGASHLRFSPTTPRQTIAPSAHRPIDTTGTGRGCGFSACGEARPAAGWMGGVGLGTATDNFRRTHRCSHRNRNGSIAGWQSLATREWMGGAG